jgi:hypothetical protein
MSLLNTLRSFFKTTSKILDRYDVKVKRRVQEVKINPKRIADRMRYTGVHSTSNGDERMAKFSGGDLIPFNLSDRDVSLIDDFYRPGD